MNDRHTLVHPRDEIVQTMNRIYRYRMTTTSGGNLSVREGNSDIWITPAQIDKGNLHRSHIVRIRADGSVVGSQKASSELPFHKAIYDARPDIQGIVHVHPIALVAFSICRQVPNTHLLPEAQQICGQVGFARYELPGTDALGQRIAQVFSQGFQCVILENHGVVIGGENLQNAFQRLETLEFVAQTIIKARMISEVNYLCNEQIAMVQRDSPAETAFTPSRPTSQEKEIRRQLCEFVRRGYRQRLLTSTQGHFSSRIDETSFLITRNDIDRHIIRLEDIVLVRGCGTTASKVSCQTSQTHQKIYNRHPQIGAIVTAHSVNATAFSVTNVAFNSRTIPESYILLRDVSRIPFRMMAQASDELAERISPEQPTAILENNGVLVTGATVLEAFDRLEVLESTAAALIESKPLGPVSPMPDAAVKGLKAKFLND